MEGVPPSFMEYDVNQLDLETLSELLLSPPEEVPVNQSSMLGNDQAGQNILMGNDVDSIQQTTQFPTPFPDQTMITMGGLDGASSSWINQNWPQTPSSEQQWTTELPMSNQVPGMLPQPPMNQCSGQFPYQLDQAPITPNLYDPQSSAMLPEPSQTLRSPQFPPHNLQVSGDHNQGQVDQASMIPHIDNMQQESLVPLNFGRSTRSQMENLQVHVLQNQNARPNASNAGPHSSLQSQNRGLNTQQDKMVRQNDLFQKHVEDMNDGSKKCKFCTHSFAKGTSISRIKWHLSGERGHGVGICGQVPKEVQEAAFLAMCGGNKKHKSIPSSCNVNDCAISTCPQDNAVQGNLAGDAGRMQEQEMGIQEHAGTLEVDAHESRGEAEQGTDVANQPFAPSVSNNVIMNDVQNMVRARIEPVEKHDVVNSGSLVQPDTGARSSRILKDNTSETRGVPFPTSSNKPVGQAFEENTKVIWSLLMDDEVSTIGIYGMGGVGKTALLQHIHNELLQRRDICDNVWWVPVSQDFSINRLQNLIAERVDKRFYRDLLREDDDLHRAAKLSKELRKKQKWILILDDLWNSFELHNVGIHPLLKGCKLILTTRSQKVCDKIDCQRKIQVKQLSEGESWTLFKENLGRHIALSDEVEGIAKVVARECAGLPLGIITIASSLRGVDDLPEWRTTLKKLRELKVRDMDEKVFKVLRVSYDRLDDELALKQCLLYCALYPEDRMIEREELIGYLIDEGIIKGMGRRQDAFDEGHTMLNRLQNVCLLESATRYDGKYCVKMHDLIRDMAIQIMQEKSQVIVKAGAQLEELPNVEEWTENLTRVSLMKNQIKEIPSSHSPMCPNLSTLFLRDNEKLRLIADSFFKQFQGLKVLDLSETSIQNLPESISDLASLTALLLTGCEWLRDVPSLKKLMALKRLDFFHTDLETMPQGMECLTNLRYLRMSGGGEKEFPSGILPKLSHLQVLVLEGYFGGRYAPITVKGKEVGSLRNLETLECHFEGLSDFVEYLRSRNGIRSLSTCKISVGTIHKFEWDYFVGLPSKTILLGNLSINADRDFQVKFLNDIQGLFCECIDARSLCDVLSLENATELEIIHIESCDSMESLVSSSWFCSATLPLPSHNGMFSRLKEFYCNGCNSMEKLFPLKLLSYLVNLEVISVEDCEKMEEIIGTTDEESVLSLENATELELIHIESCDSMESLVSSSWFCSATLPLPSHNGMFSRLKEFWCIGCNSMEKLFPLELLSYLVNLEEICVFDCEKMEEIIGTTDEESSTSNPIAELTLPKLTNLYLTDLPELKRICSAKLICNSLEEIDVENCKKLKRMAISLPLLENGQPSPHPSLKRIDAWPKEWWETVVEWEPPNAKEVLRPIVHFAEEDTLP